jgi:hypothetical protein
MNEATLTDQTKEAVMQDEYLDWCRVKLRRSPEPPAYDDQAFYTFAAGALHVALFVGIPASKSIMQVRVLGEPDTMLYEGVGSVTFLLRESAEVILQARSALMELPA